MRTQCLVAAVIAAFALTGTTNAQIVVKIPDRTPASEPYTPPAPPPAPTAPQQQPERQNPEPQEPLPDIAEFDADGNLKPLKYEKALTALRAFKFNDETWAKLEPVIKQREDTVATIVIDQVGTVITVREKLAALNDMTDSSEVLKLTSFIRTLPTSDLLVKAQAAGALTPIQRRRVENVAKAYDDAFKKQLSEQYGDDQAMEIVAVFGKSMFSDRVKEYVQSLDKMLSDTAGRAQSLLDAAGVRGVRPRSASAWAKTFTTDLTIEQQQAVLRAAYPKLATADEAGE